MSFLPLLMMALAVLPGLAIIEESASMLKDTKHATVTMMNHQDTGHASMTKDTKHATIAMSHLQAIQNSAATPAEFYVSCAICSLLGLMFFTFGIFNLIHNTGALGSFGHRFGYEMDGVMGGLLGIPHYSKIEFLMLGFAATGAFLSWTSKFELITVLGLISAASYMYICALYAYFAKLWKQEGPLFVVMGTVSAGLVCWRWTRFLDPADSKVAAIGAGCFGALVLVAGVIMMIRAPGREDVHDRFVQIFEYCEENKDFEWLAGKDAPEGFTVAGDSYKTLDN